ncbi:hypothetical protein [Gorillibacterium timonense]|uniref:hypothetical protein n=1 Tax=Gorillibacterium timonense TaxID=1689269 RepID=UPI00071C1F88|nr:hypothetical protein [Gorillibacterium timonense]
MEQNATNESFLAKVKTLIQMHKEGLLGGEIMPEDALLGIVAEVELPDVLTLGMALNYQRNAYSLWQSVAQTYRDERTRWVFQPVAAAQSSLDELRAALLSYRVALQPNRHPEIWQKVSRGIVQSSESGDVRGLLEIAQYNIARLKIIMQVTHKADFPYLSGPKIFNYWLYAMETYTGVKWKSRELITVAPDTHILKATVTLGLCPSGVLNGSAEDRKTVSEAWESALLGSGLAPIDVHTPLWLWSRAGFPPLSIQSGGIKRGQP